MTSAARGTLGPPAACRNRPPNFASLPQLGNRLEWPARRIWRLCRTTVSKAGYPCYAVPASRHVSIPLAAEFSTAARHRSRRPTGFAEPPGVEVENRSSIAILIPGWSFFPHRLARRTRRPIRSQHPWWAGPRPATSKLRPARKPATSSVSTRHCKNRATAWSVRAVGRARHPGPHADQPVTLDASA